MQALVEKIVQEKITGTQLFIVEITVKGNKINIYLDGDNGVNINECASVSHNLHKRLEEQGVDIGSYYVDVSSPGIDRNLSTLREFKKNVGRKLQVKNNQNKILKGILIYADAEKLFVLGGNNKTDKINYTQIKEAKVVI